MRIATRAIVAAASFYLLGAGAALACDAKGKVFCITNGLPLVGIQVQLYQGDPASGGTPIGDPALTDETGAYYFSFDSSPVGVYVRPTLGAGATLQEPSGAVLIDSDSFVQDFAVNDPEHCPLLGCWLTGGGAKLSRVTNMTVAEKGPKINLGGNVNPGCSPTAGDGGNWNHLDKYLDMHFQMTAIQVIDCGNVDGIPTGSTSPVTPFNYIRWQGQGRAVKPIGTEVAKGAPVCFLARAEDRNEPGSSGARDGALVDRYYIEVFPMVNGVCDTGTSLYRIGTDAEPVPITDGNLQIHVSSCP